MDVVKNECIMCARQLQCASIYEVVIKLYSYYYNYAAYIIYIYTRTQINIAFCVMYN